MNNLYFGLIFLLSAAISWFAIIYLRQRLLSRQIVDVPNERTLHEGAVPRGGGIVIIACLLVSLTGTALFDRPQTFIALSLLTLGWAGLGWRDDQHDLSPRRRFSLQILLSILTIFLFGAVSYLELSSTYTLHLGVLGVIASFVGILWFANLYNFMDGMDGLAASQTIIAALTLAFWFSQLGDQSMAVVCVVLAAASYGFLLHNWRPAKIFMGDVGSVTIGAFFATLIVIASTRHQIPVVLLVLLFGVFVADGTVTLFSRLLKGERIWLPHRHHFYQRLAMLGFDHAKIVVVYIFLMILCSVLASLAMADHDRILLVAGLGTLILLSAMLIANRLEIKKSN